jgi:1-deoxy-D-xylulose-5-phosphate synthase
MAGILERIASPKDLKVLTPEELSLLAEEVRGEILTVVSKNGGHLASNLGVVELTLALHYVFDLPDDRLVWDVGHQCYTHKLLTGRRASFPTLRQYEGVSGFPKREESPCDAFDSGHSGTSISSGLGMAEGLRHLGRKDRVIAVIGDGSMTSGLAFEGFNQAGHLDKDLIVVLNDNEMSISPNVGALSSYLNRLMTGQFVNRARDEVRVFLETLPGIGKSVLKFAKQAEESLKGLFMPGLLFEELGFQYIGPIDGHRLDHLIETFQNVRKLRGPILLHVITKKGKGYLPAERNPARYHSVSPFAVDLGLPAEAPQGLPTYTDVFGRTLCRLAAECPKLVAITAAMLNGTGLEPFSKAFPERFYDIGIAEQHAVTFAAGLALEGMKPVVAIYSTFFQRAYDQVVQDVCLQNLPVVFCLDRAGIVGEDGPTHHGVFDLSFLRAVPNLTLMAPRDENELQHMLRTAIDAAGPVVIRYPRGRGTGAALDEELHTIPLGRAEVLRQGNDLVILGVGATVAPAFKAADRLESMGVHAGVINGRFVKPLDEELILKWAFRTRRVLTVEDNALQGGFGSAVLELLSENGVTGVEVRRLGLPDRFLDHGPQSLLRTKYGIDEEGIFTACVDFLRRGTSVAFSPGRVVSARRP